MVHGIPEKTLWSPPLWSLYDFLQLISFAISFYSKGVWCTYCLRILLHAGNCPPKLCDFSSICLSTQVRVNRARMVSLLCKYEIVCLYISIGDWILTSWSSRGKQTARIKLNNLKFHMNVNGKSSLLFKVIYGVKKTKCVVATGRKIKSKTSASLPTIFTFSTVFTSSLGLWHIFIWNMDLNSPAFN